MRADNTAHLIAATRRRHELARSKAIRAIRELDASGTTVTFESVARAAGDVQILALHPAHIRADVLRLRDLGRRALGMSVPARHRSKARPAHGASTAWRLPPRAAPPVCPWLALIKPDCNCPSYFTVIIQCSTGLGSRGPVRFLVHGNSAHTTSFRPLAWVDPGCL
jgi:hypothetical protein